MSPVVNALHFDDNSLIPAVVQDAASGDVLMFAYMNREALEQTLATGETHFWSRSRESLWHKGETSGNVQRVREIHVDCDGDALLVAVDPAGNACHTGERSCFHRPLEDDRLPDPRREPRSTRGFLARLEGIIADRRDRPVAGSYTNALLDNGLGRILKKLGEETTEVILAATSEGRERILYEVGDLLYHLLVLLAHRGISLEDVERELARRHSGDKPSECDGSQK